MNLREIEFRVVKFEIRNAEWMHGDGRKEKEKVKFETIYSKFETIERRISPRVEMESVARLGGGGGGVGDIEV